MEKEIEILTNKREVKVAGETIIIKPWSFMKMFEVVKPISALIPLAAVHAESISVVLECFKVKSEKDDDGKVNETLSIVDSQKLAQTVMQLMTALSEDSDKLVKNISDVIKITLGKDQAFIDNLTMQEAFDILSAIYAVNKGFFQERLAKRNTPSGKTKK